MASERHLNKAPITEAVIDVRVKLPAEHQDVMQIAKFTHEIQRQFSGRFLEEKHIREMQVRFETGPPARQESSSSHVGYRYDSQDGKHVIQAKIDGFTFSWLKPYEDWEALRQAALTTWQIYRDTLNPDAITRVAARFINQFEIPGPGIDFDHYLTAAPPIPKELPQGYAGFLTRLAIPDPINEATILITQSFQPGINPSVVPVLLDIDVFKDKLIENEGVGWDRMAWDTIDKLRAIKNKVFFESITEKTAELFQ